MNPHPPGSTAHRSHQGRHRRPRRTVRKAIHNRLIVPVPTRNHPARDIAIRARTAAARQRRGGRDA